MVFILRGTSSSQFWETLWVTTYDSDGNKHPIFFRKNLTFFRSITIIKEGVKTERELKVSRKLKNQQPI